MKISAFTKTYEKKVVLHFPDFELGKGKITAVIGSNGSGKSTLAKVLAGIEPSDQKNHPMSNGSVGYLPQKSYGFHMSVQANLMLNKQDKELASRRMDALKINDLAKKRADRLSGGETARMALARLLMGTYDLLILDEPTAAMDRESTLLAEELIKEYVKETGCAVLLITHSLQQARRIADEAIYLHAGELLEAGTVDQILYHPSRPETVQFLEFYGFV
jgi:ABC-type Mn2+/Zn2+ transport system ATPase subunit